MQTKWWKPLNAAEKFNDEDEDGEPVPKSTKLDQ